MLMSTQATSGIFGGSDMQYDSCFFQEKDAHDIVGFLFVYMKHGKNVQRKCVAEDTEPLAVRYKEVGQKGRLLPLPQRCTTF